MYHYPFFLYMNMFLIAFGALIAGALISLAVSYFLPKEKIRTANQMLEKEEQEAKLRIKDLEKEYVEKNAELEQQYTQLSNQLVQDLEKQNRDLTDAANQKLAEINTYRTNWEKEKNEKLLDWTRREAELNLEVQKLEERRSNIIQTLEKEAQESGKIFREQQIQIAEEQIEKAKTEMQQQFNSEAEQAKNNYLYLLEESSEEYLKELEEINIKLEEAKNSLSEARIKANAIIEVNKRAEMEKEQKDFYRLQLTEIDIEEIKRIRSIEPYLRKTEPLNKVIWKSYYEKPYTDLIGRVVGQNRKSGIYKITNINNGKVYVGQAVDIAERWRQHIKRGIGADPPTQNKLYPAMLAEGVENFTFEIIEECPAAKLTEREKYYTDIFAAQSYGYVVRKG